MPHPFKVVLLVVAGIAGLFLVALLALVLLVDPNRFKPQLITAVQQQTGRELRIDGELGWSFYPVLGVDIGRTELANAPGFDAGPMLAVQRVAVGVQLLPLLRGALNVSQLRLEQPVIRLAKDAQGRSSWEDILDHRRQREAERGPATAAAPDAGEPDSDMTVEIGSLQLVEAAVHWRDAQKQQDFSIAPLNLQTGAIRVGEPVLLETSVAFASSQPALRGKLKLTAELTADDNFDRLVWRDLKLTLHAIGEALPADSLSAELRGSGEMDLQAQRLQFDNGELEFNLVASGDGVDTKGELRFAIRGDLAQQRFESDNLELTAALSGGELPGDGQSLTLRTPLRLDLGQQTLALPAVAASGAGIDLKARVEGSQIIDQPAFSGALEIALPLRKLLDDLQIELPEIADSTTLRSIALQSDFRATPQHLELSKLQLAFDDSNLRGTLNAGLGDITRLGFDLTLDRIDLDRYLPAEEAAPAQPVAAPAPTSSPPADDQTFAFLDTLALDGRIAIGQLQVKNLDLRDVALTAKSAGRHVVLDPLTASLYGGKADFRIELDARSATPQTRVRSSLQQVQLGALLDAWLQKRGPIEGSGNLDAQLDFTGLDTQAILGSLNGGGELRLADGAVRGINVAQEIRNALALIKRQPRQEAALKTDFTELVVPFKLAAGNFSWSQLGASSPLFRIGSKGEFNLASQALDTKLDVTVVQSLKGQGGEALGEVAGLLVPVKLRGTLNEPNVSVDLVKVLEQTRLGAKKEELEAELKQKAKAREDELKAREEELKGKASKELQRGLDRLFKKTPDSDSR